MSTKLLQLAMLGVCSIYASGAHAVDYISTRSVGAASVSFSLTTDGTLGVLNASNITNYAVTITSGANSINFAPGNASIFVFGTALSATATNLNFDFGGAGSSFLVFNRGAGLGDHYCFETSGCSGAFNNAESFRFGQNGAFTGEARSGVQAIASVAAANGAVPEPATWAMMIVGFGAIGGTLRRRQNVAARVRFA